MAKRVGVDKWLFGTVLALVLFGLVMIFSTSAVMAKAQFGSAYRFVLTQAVYVVLGIIALFGLMRVDYRRYNNPKVVFPSIAITAALLLSVFFMRGMNGAHRWVRVGGFTLQPSELAKPLIVLFLAYFLQSRIHQIDDWRNTLLRAAAVPLLFIVLILKEPDLGTAIVCAGVTCLMLLLAGIQLRYIGIAFAAATPVLYYMLFHVAWRRARMLAFINPTGNRIPHSAIAHRCRHGRLPGQGPD
jgi:cell division protein FtsW